MILFSHGETLTPEQDKSAWLVWTLFGIFCSILYSQIIKLKWYSNTLKFLSFVLSFFFPGFYRGTQCSRRGLKIWSFSLQHDAIRNYPIVIWKHSTCGKCTKPLCLLYSVQYTCLSGSTPFCLQNSMNSKLMDSRGCW